MAIRNGVSDRAVTAICNAKLQDLNHSDDTNKLDRHKVSREKRMMSECLRDNNKQRMGLLAITFDARKDNTKVSVEKYGDKKVLHTVKVEHICVLEEPGSLYIDHCTVENCKATTISS